MKTLFQHLRHFATDENGPTSVEYAVMLALIIAGVIFTVIAVGQNVSAMYHNVSEALNGGAGGGAGGGAAAGM